MSVRVKKILSSKIKYWENKRNKKKNNNNKKKIVTAAVEYRGVHKSGNRYTASIQLDGKRGHLGMFDTAKAAAEAYDVVAMQAKRPRCDLNFPNAAPESYE